MSPSLGSFTHPSVRIRINHSFCCNPGRFIENVIIAFISQDDLSIPVRMSGVQCEQLQSGCLAWPLPSCVVLGEFNLSTLYLHSFKWI